VLALADEVGAAWAFAHYARYTGSCIVPTSQQSQRLAAFPVAALRLPEHALDKLRALGLCRIEQLQALPRSSLPSRIGSEVLLRLDQAMGDAPELILPVRPPALVTARMTLPTSTANRETLGFVLRSLIDQIVTRLTDRCEGVQQLEVRMDCGPDAVTTFLAGTAQPSACPNHLTELILTRLEQTVLLGEVQAVQLTVNHSGPLEVRQRQLFEQDDHETLRRELMRLVDRLSNRLGKERVARPRIYPDILPERALRWEPHLDCAPLVPPPAPAAGIVAARPLRLLLTPQPISVTAVVPQGPPVRFNYQNHTYLIQQAWGPERLAAGWWRGSHVQRDYYRVDTDKGQRFWLFRCVREEDWYLHGEFD